MVEVGVYKKGEISLEKIFYQNLASLPKDCGALISFIGVVKNKGLNDKEVSKLEIEAYKEHADKVIKRICDEVKEKYKVGVVKIYHLEGSFIVGEPLVMVLVASRSRKEGFEAIKEAIERYKKEPALWKKEIYVNGTHRWIS
jgi:molybdopterin synthase catalytic subunit